MSDSLPFKGKWVIVCGGSKGIGKETARLIARKGGSLMVIARELVSLQQAGEEIKSACPDPSQVVETLSCDVTKIESLKPCLEGFITKYGVPDYLINVVGYAEPNYVQRYSLKDFELQMETNYFGQLIPTQIMLPYFIEARKGHISFISSMNGFLSLIGYAAYSPSKFALVGLAETLRHELKPYNISISILYPPDTDTPGYVRENRTKPRETALLSETASLVSPEQVAETYVNGLLKNKFEIMSGEVRLFKLVMRFTPWLLRAYGDYQLKKIQQKNSDELTDEILSAKR